MAGDSWLSKWILSLADAAGQLDDAELRALAGLLEEGESRQVIAAALPQLHARPDAPIAQRVAEVLDHLWKHWPNEPITVVRLPSPASDKPAMATTRAAPQTPLYEHLKGLEDLEAEIKKGAVIPGGSTTEQDKR